MSTTAPARSRASYRRVMLALGLIGATTFVQLYYPQALIPAISHDLGVAPADAALTVSGATIGIAAAVLGWSWLAGRFGPAPVMKVALLAAAVLGLLAPFAPSFEALIVVRVLHGICLGGTPALALTFLAEEVDQREALTAAGTYVSGTVIGGLAGRLFAAPVADLTNWRTGAFAVGVLAATGALVAVLLLPAVQEARRPPQPLWFGVVRSLRSPALLVLYAQAFLLMGAHVAVYNYLGYRLERAPFDLPATLTALIFLAGLSGAVSARLAGRWAARFGRRTVLRCASATMALGAALTIPDRLPVIVLGLLVFTTAYFVAHSIASGWVGPTASGAVAQATALYTLSYYAGASLFGWLGGLAFNVGWRGTAALVIVIVLGASALANAHRPGRERTGL